MMICHCTLAGTQACKNCPRYKEYFGEQIKSISTLEIEKKKVEVGTICYICDKSFPINWPEESTIRICPECRNRLKKILYQERGEE